MNGEKGGEREGLGEGKKEKRGGAIG